MHAIYEKPKTFIDKATHFCPGCGHGIVLRLIAEIIDAWGIRGKTIGLAPVGCAVLAYNYLDIDMCEAAHGRPPAVATGIKRVHPGHIVFSYQGDGDLAAIGTAEIIHAANRGELITVIFINNAVYGMTGCQEEKRGFSLVEILSPCPTYWKMAPAAAAKFVDEVMTKTFPLGVYRDWE